MLPSQLRAESFAGYPPQARALAVGHLALLQQLPLVLAALLLRETSSCDWRFPAERSLLDRQYAFLASLAPRDRNQLLSGFAAIQAPAAAERTDWAARPQSFLDALSSGLWATGQIDALRAAAGEYQTAWRKAMPEPQPAVARLSIVVLGRDLPSPEYPLFRKLRPHGVFFPEVDGGDAWPSILTSVSARAAAHPIDFGHWYIDGDAPDAAADPRLTQVAWTRLQPVREAVLARIQKVIDSGRGGPEELRTAMAQTTPAELHLRAQGWDEVLDRFRISILTEGSGTQIFSTTFVQWTAREALRRAEPCTLLLRFTPRQRQLAMNELLSASNARHVPDPAGSVMDADMGAYYTWINQQRLSGAEQSGFLAWSEASRQAVAIGPSMARGTVAANQPTMKQLLGYLS
ncbi:MAG: hypothetical protein WB974_10570 [Acidobacteriaceae bacterium]